MLSDVKTPKNKQELIGALNKKNPLKFSVIEYDPKTRSQVLSALDKSARKGKVSLIIVEA